MDGLKMKYFVLKPEGRDIYAEASRFAMHTYAEVIESENPQLAKELDNWIEKETENAQTESIEVDLSDETFRKIAEMAHERDITFNEMCVSALREHMERLEFDENRTT